MKNKELGIHSLSASSHLLIWEIANGNKEH